MGEEEIKKVQGLEQGGPTPEDTATALSKVHSDLARKVARMSLDLAGVVNNIKPNESAWPKVAETLERVESLTAQRFAQIAILALREVLAKGNLTAAQIEAEFVIRISEELGKILPPSQSKSR